MKNQTYPNITWLDYSKGLRMMFWGLDKLQTDKDGVNHPHRLPRKTPSPAAMTALKNGVDVYSESRSEYLRFKEKVFADFFSPATEPATFENPFYSDLRAFLESELRESEMNKTQQDPTRRHRATRYPPRVEVGG
jgi:hypothetical protein